MREWTILIAVVCLLICFPLLRCAWKRLRCARKIRQVCRKHGYLLHPTHFLWFGGSKHIKRCDCYIETAGEVIAVKLFGVPRWHTQLVFGENGEYFVRSYIAFATYSAMIRNSIDGKSHAMPGYDFRYRYRDEWEIKTPRHILLMNPVSMEVCFRSQRGDENILGAGDLVNGMEIFSLSRFLGELENAG